MIAIDHDHASAHDHAFSGRPDLEFMHECAHRMRICMRIFRSAAANRYQISGRRPRARGSIRVLRAPADRKSRARAGCVCGGPDATGTLTPPSARRRRRPQRRSRPAAAALQLRHCALGDAIVGGTSGGGLGAPAPAPGAWGVALQPQLWGTGARDTASRTQSVTASRKQPDATPRCRTTDAPSRVLICRPRGAGCDAAAATCSWRRCDHDGGAARPSATRESPHAGTHTSRPTVYLYSSRRQRRVRQAQVKTDASDCHTP